MLDRLEFLIGEAFVSLRRNGLMTFAAISTAAVALFLLGGLGYVYYRVSQYTTTVTNKFEMHVYMAMKTPPERVEATKKAIEALPGVSSVKFMPRDLAWKQTAADVHISQDGLDNPLPDAFDVQVSDLKRADAIAATIQNMPDVYQDHGVEYLKDVQQLMDTILQLVRLIGGVLGCLLFTTAGVLIYNAIRLTVIARRREIRIMQLVGASYFTVRTPFVIEGMIQGTIGGILATFLLALGQAGVQKFIDRLTTAVTIPSFPMWPIMVVLMAGGATYGLLCASWAVKEPLRHGSTGLQR